MNIFKIIWERKKIYKYTTAIAYLCGLLDSMLYIPFKKMLIYSSDFGFIKEKFKLEIEKTINELKED